MSFFDNIDIEPIPFELVFEHDTCQEAVDFVTDSMISEWLCDTAKKNHSTTMASNGPPALMSSDSTCTTASWSNNMYLMIGEHKLRAIVNESLQRVVQDLYLEFFLRGFCMDDMRDHFFSIFQTTLFMCQNNAGVNNDGNMDFDDDDENVEFERFFDQIQTIMVDDHQRLFSLGLKEGHFDLVLGHVVLAMENCGLDRTMITRIVPILARFRQIFEEGALEAKSKHFHACQSLRC